ncbi:MAG: dTDP-4-dehydrorhamnose reductase [Planctomycetaceae bacterium]
MRIAVIGATGQLGTELCNRIGEAAVPLGHAEVELTSAESIHAALSQLDVTAVINAAAYNLVDKAEDEPEVAYAVNALGPRQLARYCESRGVPFVHISSDFVFGLDAERSTPYRENDAPGPQSAYAVSKLAGECFVRGNCRRHFVLRTCGLFGPTRELGRGNFVETMIRLAKERGELKVVSDQRCTPTSTRDLAIAIIKLLETEEYGLYHATNSGSTTWHGFATEIVKVAGLKVPVHAISSLDFAAKAKRPSYSVLDCQKLTSAAGFAFPSWQEALADYVTDRQFRIAKP